MNAQKLARLPLQTGYVFENGTSYYEKLGDERAASLLKALSTAGYRIVSVDAMRRPDGQDIDAARGSQMAALAEVKP